MSDIRARLIHGYHALVAWLQRVPDLRRPAPRKKYPRRRVLRLLLLTIAATTILDMVGLSFVYTGYSGYLSELPDVALLPQLGPPSDSFVYASDGTLLADLHDPNFRHIEVPFSAIPKSVIDATISIEDRHFYTEGSLDLPRVISSAIADLKSGAAAQGASTIPEQLAKISFLSFQKTINRKIEQVILGNEIEQTFTKNQILDMYLNRVTYGNHAIGIGTAAVLYFHEPVQKLDLAQAAMLAGLPEAPTLYNPLNHAANVAINPQAKRRQGQVLQSMVTNHYITQSQADAAFNEPITVYSWTTSEVLKAPYFVGYLEQYLTSHFGDAYLDPGGWNIYTSLNTYDQSVAEQETYSNIKAIYSSHNAHDAALVSMDPRTGEVVAMVGAWNQNDPSVNQLNMAILPRQPGSTIKLFTYSAGIATDRITMTTTIRDEPTVWPGGYSPSDYGHVYRGTCVVPVCLDDSINIPAVKIEYATGIPFITNLEIEMGLTSLAEPANRPTDYNYAATLGGLTYGVSPLEMTDGISTIADLGVHHPPTPITKIVDAATGTTVYSYNPSSVAQQVLPPNVAYIMSQITSDNNARITEFGANNELILPNRRVSAKTGTTDFFVDNWTVGWTPTLATSVWVGNPDPSCLKPQDTATLAKDMQTHIIYAGQNITDPYSPEDLAAYGLKPANSICGHLVNSIGITGAAPIWHDYMNRALAMTPPTWYTMPSGVVAVGGGGNDGTFYMEGPNGVPYTQSACGSSYFFQSTYTTLNSTCSLNPVGANG